ncbi:NlpC/P60 family protein [Lichenihabitans sp. Uapishka_5]|uniref:C40 family peptidase n=1 Tax=Lichenihabitans sp. Uapishka_5 TaxID=3037302 RepID=UPI0029E818AB|nr:NlpC/P60 family protein [Lichenihabitans sp. Uapishka_5]MDX7953091.1 NlpC/P60 family protein [Lichenihabitans sp. Uapishka_5]
MTQSFDRRLTPARPDRAAAFLRGQVEAATFVEGEVRSIAAAAVPLRRAPRLDCALDTEAVRGEAVTVYDTDAEGWAWVQLAGDGYCGYLPAEALGPSEAPTHRVAALRTLVFPGPDLKLPIIGALTLGAKVGVGETVGTYARIREGFVPAGHLRPLDDVELEAVAVAERFLGVPYLWGGKTSLGLDCSALVQVAHAAAGRAVPRDSDMQEQQVGAPLPDGTALRRGDLVFWRGHVGLMRDTDTLLHANAHAMAVTSEPLAEARRRILAATGADVTAIRRP